MDAGLPVLYSFRRCPYAMRARMAIAIAGARCELREVLLKSKPTALLALSAKATVPVLQLRNGDILDESLDIMRWALAQLKGDSAADWLPTSDADYLIEQNDGPFKYHLDRYKYPQRFGLETDGLTHRQSALDWLVTLDRRLAVTKQMCGDKPGLADIALFPFVRQFAAVEPGWFAVLPCPHLQQWLADWLDSGEFHAVMGRFAPWQEGAEPVHFPSSGGGL